MGLLKLTYLQRVGKVVLNLFLKDLNFLKIKFCEILRPTDVLQYEMHLLKTFYDNKTWLQSNFCVVMSFD